MGQKFTTKIYRSNENTLNKILKKHNLHLHEPFAGIVTLDVGFGGHHEIRIKHISTPVGERGKGYASNALRWICAVADQNRLAITLCPSPMDDEGLTRQQLMAWYKRHGFVNFGDLDDLIRRAR